MREGKRSVDGITRPVSKISEKGKKSEGGTGLFFLISIANLEVQKGAGESSSCFQIFSLSKYLAEETDGGRKEGRMLLLNVEKRLDFSTSPSPTQKAYGVRASLSLYSYLTNTPSHKRRKEDTLASAVSFLL